MSPRVESVDGSGDCGHEGFEQVPESRFMVFYSCINDPRNQNDEGGVVLSYAVMRGVIVMKWRVGM